MGINKEKMKGFFNTRIIICLLTIMLSFNLLIISSMAMVKSENINFKKDRQMIPIIKLDEETKYAYNQETIHGKVVIDSTDGWKPDNEKTFLSYHVYSSDGELIVWDGKRFPIKKNSDNQYYVEYNISLKKYLEKSNGQKLNIEFDMVVEGSYWYSQLENFKTSSLDVNYTLPIIKKDWTLFPKVYISGDLIYIPAKFSISTNNPESFHFKPSIRIYDEDKMLESARKEIGSIQENQEITTMIPFNVPQKTGIYKVKLGFVHDGVMWYPQNNVESRGILVVNPIVPLFLWVIIIIFTLSLKKYTNKFLTKLRKNKHGYIYIYLIIVSIIMFVLLIGYVLYPTIFSLIGIQNLGILIPLAIIIHNKIKPRIYIPIVVLCHMIAMEVSMSLKFNVHVYGIMIACIIIIILNIILNISFKWEKIGILLSILLLVLGTSYYISQLYYFKFFNDFFSISSLGYSEQLFDTIDSIVALTGKFEKLILIMFIVNFTLIMWSLFKKKSIDK